MTTTVVNTRSNRRELGTKILSIMGEFGSKTIKSSIGDSVNNNRVPTVSQLTRFLSKRRRKDLVRTGVLLKSIYPKVKDNAAWTARSGANFRTDALDVYELVSFLKSS